MRVINHTTAKVKENWTATKRVTRNVIQFLDAVFLATTSVYAIYVFVHRHNDSLWYYGLGLSGVAITFQAFRLLWKSFDHE